MKSERRTLHSIITTILLALGFPMIRPTSGLSMLPASSNLAKPSSISAAVGSLAPEWHVADWLNSKPVKLADLRGKVVLVRWWTEGCPYCRATAPALNEFYNRFRSRGLEVVGLYHHKSAAPLKVDRVHQYAKVLGFRFPVAIDHEWRTLREWWLDASGEQWTSVSFLIDRKGVIRHIHSGGQYVDGDQDHRTMKAKIEELLQ